MKTSSNSYDILIVGGGLAGLISSILLARQQLNVLLIEKNSYPFHRVCGEYISNEVRSFLIENELYPPQIATENIDQFMLSATSGKFAMIDLPLGGFGISRFYLDNFLYRKAIEAGVNVHLEERVKTIHFANNRFEVQSNKSHYNATFCIGSWGKRDRLDKEMSRKFSTQKAPYVGIKKHIKLSYPERQIALHNFPGGYCGISRVEADRVNLCYLIARDKVREAGDIENLERTVLSQNPHLKAVFDAAEMLFEKPMVINEVSFAPKKPIENHIIMAGDTAGLITPLCGNGMAMAIHAGKLAAESIGKYYKNENFKRDDVEKDYSVNWQQNFQMRLRAGRNIQKLFGNASANLAVAIIKNSPWLAKQIVKLTHGKQL